MRSKGPRLHARPDSRIVEWLGNPMEVVMNILVAVYGVALCFAGVAADAAMTTYATPLW